LDISLCLKCINAEPLFVRPPDEAVITKYVTTGVPFGHLNYCEWFLDAMPYLHAAHAAAHVSFVLFMLLHKEYP